MPLFKRPRLTIFFIMAILNYSCGKEAAAPSASSSPFDSDDSDLHWDIDLITSSPLDLRVSTTLATTLNPGNTTNAKTETEEMMQLWNDALGAGGIDFFTIPSNTTPNISPASLITFRDSVMGVYKSLSWYDEVGSSALAITQYFAIDQGSYYELVHADIIFNYRDFTFTLDTVNGTDYDFKTVILHELGHFIGLPHNTTINDSIMHPYLGIMETHNEVYAEDVTSLSDLYDNALYLRPAETQYASALVGDKSEDEIEEDATGEKAKKKTVVRGIIQMMADGQCLHIVDGKLKNKHNWK